MLVGGEAGSGKSRLVREFARRGGARAARSSSTARATRSSTRRTAPFVEALDHLARVLDPAELRAALGTTGGELARLLPDLARTRRGARRAPTRTPSATACTRR